MNLGRIFILDEIFAKGAFRPSFSNYSKLGEELMREYHRGAKKPSCPLKLGWAEGIRMVDFTSTTAVLPYVVSERFIEVLSTHKITGWSTYPIELRGRNGDVIEGFCALTVNGKCGKLDYEKSRKEKRIGPTGGSYEVKVGLFFDESTWDGSDMFTPAETSFIFVVERVKEVLSSANLTNIGFVDASTHERQW